MATLLTSNTIYRILALLVSFNASHGYFFGKWDSATSPSPTAHPVHPINSLPSSSIGTVKTINANEYRMNGYGVWSPAFNPPPAKFASDNGGPSAGLPLPFAVHFPQQVIPVMIPTYDSEGQSKWQLNLPSTPTVVVTEQHSQLNGQPQSSPLQPEVTTISSGRQRASSTDQTQLYRGAYPQAIQLVPCLCNSVNKEQQYRLAKGPYQSANAPYSLQTIQLLPCYCPIIKDFDSQLTQQNLQPESDGSSSFAQTSTPVVKL